MTDLVIGGDCPFSFADNAALARRASHHAINRLFKLTHTNAALIAPCSQDSCLVEQVGEISPGKAWRLFRQRLKRDILIQWLIFSVYL